MKTTSTASTEGCIACHQLNRADFPVKDQSNVQLAITNLIQNEMHSVHLIHIDKPFQIILLKINKLTKSPRKSFYKINLIKEWKAQHRIVLTSQLKMYLKIAQLVPTKTKPVKSGDGQTTVQLTKLTESRITCTNSQTFGERRQREARWRRDNQV